MHKTTSIMTMLALGILGLVIVGATAAVQQDSACCPADKSDNGTFSKVPAEELASTKWLDRANGPQGNGWLRLFNGRDLSGWVSNHPDKPSSWKATDGMMVNESSHDHRGNNLFTQEKWDDFELYYEYCIPEGSNSGMYLRGRYEIQIFDSFAEQKRDWTVNGAIWNAAVPYYDVDRKAGEWQSVYARIVDKKVTVVLNTTLIHDEFKVPFPTGGELDRNEALPGPIMIQGDHGGVQIRNIYLRPIE